MAGRRGAAACHIPLTSLWVALVVLEPPHGNGADVVFDPVGGELATAALQGLGSGGRFLAIGFASGEWVKVDTHELVWRNQSLVGVLAAGRTREEDEADHEALLALAAADKLRSLTTTVGVHEVPDALEQVAAGSAMGKLVVDFANG